MADMRGRALAASSVSAWRGMPIFGLLACGAHAPASAVAPAGSAAAVQCRVVLEVGAGEPQADERAAVSRPPEGVDREPQAHLVVARICDQHRPTQLFATTVVGICSPLGTSMTVARCWWKGHLVDYVLRADHDNTGLPLRPEQHAPSTRLESQSQTGTETVWTEVPAIAE